MKKQKIKEIYGKHKNLYWFLRETVSYNLIKEILPNANIFLCPDMALLLEPVKGTKGDRENILMCLRSDKEKKLQKQDEERIEKAIVKYYLNEKIEYTDTVLDKNVWLNERSYEVYKKIDEFSKAKLIVTDRLHGMVFAALAETPCIVCGNVNHKVKGIYQWIENNEYIRYVEDIEMIEETVEELSKYSNPTYDNTSVKERYKILENVILERK
ncbi:MAG: polysaccharide pyruvyl transferase family protein [Lachnospiraceae bacterium]|nr:polysaccharide pyruvyl transferase family protein [Lachnospiraceae bacterium]